MQVFADLEVHSKYARAVSSSMNVPTIAEWADKKGISLVGSGDFTHPMWFRELRSQLAEDSYGIYKLKGGSLKSRFLLTSEVSCIYLHDGKGRRVHILVYLPGFDEVERFNTALTSHGANLFSDGRPIIGLTLAQVAALALEASPKALIIPAHVWTPWFGFYGSMSGYDSLHEAFGDLVSHIPAVETGLSSDPAMNWKIGELTGKSIVSFGDAHSPQKLGREATVFEIERLSYDAIYNAFWRNGGDRIAFTIEFYPEEGKYHYTGHRKCNVAYSPNEARKLGMTCPVCGKSLTLGVASRVETLATTDIETISETDSLGVRWIKAAGPDGRWPGGNKSPYVMLVPLLEILSESLGLGVATQGVTALYDHVVTRFGSEFDILLKTKISDLENVAGTKVAEAVSKVRSGDIFIKPGFDGVFGKVKIWKEKEREKENPDQTPLF
jgi:uncharacterized protein (TIGR00375 family)